MNGFLLEKLHDMILKYNHTIEIRSDIRNSNSVIKKRGKLGKRF